MEFIKEINNLNKIFLENLKISREDLFLLAIAETSKNAFILKVKNTEFIISSNYNLALQIALRWGLNIRSREYQKKIKTSDMDLVTNRIMEYIPIYEIIESIKKNRSTYNYQFDKLTKEITLNQENINTNKNINIAKRFDDYMIKSIYEKNVDFNTQAKNIIKKRATSYQHYMKLFNEMKLHKQLFWLDTTEEEWSHFYKFYRDLNNEIIGKLKTKINNIDVECYVKVITSIQTIAKISYYKVYLIIDTLNNSNQLSTFYPELDGESFFVKVDRKVLIDYISVKTELSKDIIDSIITSLTFDESNNSYMTHPLVKINNDICFSLFVGDNYVLSFEDLCNSIDRESYPKVSDEISNNLLNELIEHVAKYDNWNYVAEEEIKKGKNTLFEIDFAIKDENSNTTLIFERKTLKLSSIANQKGIDSSMEKGDSQLKKISDYLNENKNLEINGFGEVLAENSFFSLLTKFSTGNFENENKYPIIIHGELINIFNESNGNLKNVIDKISELNNFTYKDPSTKQLNWGGFKFIYPSY